MNSEQILEWFKKFKVEDISVNDKNDFIYNDRGWNIPISFNTLRTFVEDIDRAIGKAEDICQQAEKIKGGMKNE